MPKILYTEENGKFKSRYRVQSNRNQNWDYGDEGYYFITICTKDREEYFGKIKDGEMILNNIGKIVNQFWFEIPKHFPFVQLDEFIVMPNHVHGVVVIESDESVETCCNNIVETCHGMSLQKNNMSLQKQEIFLQCGNREFGKPIKKSLSMIINHLKGSVKRFCNKNNINFYWQPNYHDRIIRNEKELFNIRKYIQENPLKWEEDEYFLNSHRYSGPASIFRRAGKFGKELVLDAKENNCVCNHNKHNYDA